MYNTGDIITLKEFCFTNKYGGTGLSNWDHDEKFKGEAKVKITKSWHDDECGQRGWGEPISQDLIDYLKRNAKQTITVHTNPTDVFDKTIIPVNTIFWSEFDITDYQMKKL